MYQGPRMSSRYCMLVLSDDWYVPGENRRHKRKHTKTHGKISFCDLSKSIAQAWSNTSAEICEYCENLCDIGLLQYKKAMRKYQNSLKRAKIKSSEKDKKVDHTKIRMKHKKANQTIEASSQKVSSEKSNPPNAHALFTPQKRRQSDFGAAVDIFLTHIQAGGSNAQEEFAELCVDMNDDEIRNLWAPGHYPPQKYVPIMPITEVSLSNAMFCAEIGSDMCCGLCSDVPQPSEVWLGGYAM